MVPPTKQHEPATQADQGEAGIWQAPPEELAASNVGWLIRAAGVDNYDALHAWSVRERESYWARAIERLDLRFAQNPARVLDPGGNVEASRWLPGARLNIVESCFQAAADDVAIRYQPEGGQPGAVTYGDLRTLTARVAAGLTLLGCRPGDAVAIFLPMTVEAVAIYLGIVWAGCAAVGIADSFQPLEIATRLRLSKAVAVFTQDTLLRGGRVLPLYAHLAEIEAVRAVVLPARETLTLPLRPGDLAWGDFLPVEAPPGAPLECAPDDTINVLFSSGTTGEPKAIPWTHTTPIKCAADAHFHLEVRPDDTLAWPTNLGWMMGPWLVFASLLNRGTLALYYGAPTGRPFCRFVQDVRATMLGVIPSLVKAWRAGEATAGCDWSALRTFASTGECSTPADMRWLSAQAGGRPVIEYCGGTEIGGGYITGTIARPCVPGQFNTPALGLDFVILDPAGQPADSGEVFLLGPSVGLSARLLNQDHHAVYFDRTPAGPHGETLRRHGDEMERVGPHAWQGHGRADDTMNLGGIKVSSAEIERVLHGISGIVETAAIAVPSPGGGPSRLVVYAVPSASTGTDRPALLLTMQKRIKSDLNPLFKIHDLVLIEKLPRTASNKVMRRELREHHGTLSAT